jgi:hypothetical protein
MPAAWLLLPDIVCLWAAPARGGGGGGRRRGGGAAARTTFLDRFCNIK